MADKATRRGLQKLMENPTVTDILRACGICNLVEHASPEAIQSALQKLGRQAESVGDLTRAMLMEAAQPYLRTAGLKAPKKAIDAALAVPNGGQDKGEGKKLHGHTIALTDPEPWEGEVDGSVLAEEVAALIGGLTYLPAAAVDAIAVWVLATYCVEHLYFAPILTVWSPTKGCGKSTLFDLLNWLVRRGFLTSGPGVTAATVFRLNDARHPTMLIDEAEKLGGRNANTELIGLLNNGYRRGGVVSRCVEAGSDYEIQAFDAFGFRALNSIRPLWDTIMDRSIEVRIERKPRSTQLSRFNARLLEPQCRRLARKIHRWALDQGKDVGEAEAEAIRPNWLPDRPCDNWGPLFAVGAVVGSGWDDRILEAARLLVVSNQEADRHEHLIHDVRRVFRDRNAPQAISSTDLVEALNRLDDSPWGDERQGKGISTHSLAKRLPAFNVQPRQGRITGGGKLRGYWAMDMESVWERYPEVGQPGQANNDATFSGFQSGTAAPTRPTSEAAEARINKEMSHLSHLETGERGDCAPSTANGSITGELFVDPDGKTAELAETVEGEL